MATGLYTKNNLSEGGINSKEAVQKLYGPQVQEDILLFSFASRLESKISSADLSNANQISGIFNSPISDSAGNVTLRTKFLTNGITFTNENLVWFESFLSSFDKRTGSEVLIGAPIKVSVNGSITSVELLGLGERYKVLTPAEATVTLPASVTVNVLGKSSGAKNAQVVLTINTAGEISRGSGVSVINPGSGYIAGEELELILGCVGDEVAADSKCIRYTTNFLTQEVFFANKISSKAYIKNGLYKYRVKFSSRNGFFLFDEYVNKYVYLGSFYNTVSTIPAADSPLMVVKRKDTITSSNILQLYNLDGRSLSWDYSNSYGVSGSLYQELRDLLSKIESLQTEFSLFIQNTKDQAEESGTNNTLGIKYNIIEGKNISSSYRVIFRDPDGVLDSSSVTFNTLSTLNQPGQTTVDGKRVPGIWLWTGEKYQRAFSSSDKPFISLVDKNFLSPAIYKLDGTQVASSGEFKYSISTGYLKPGTSVIRGFDTQISTLVQNISGTNPASGGFVYYRTLTPTLFNGSNVKAWPLFSYKENNTIKDIKILAI